MAQQNKEQGFQQSAGLIRYFDAEEETAIHIDPRIVLLTTFFIAFAVLLMNVFMPIR